MQPINHACATCVQNKSPAEGADPVSVWDGLQRWGQAEGVAAPVAAVTEDDLVLVVPASAELAVQGEDVVWHPGLVHGRRCRLDGLGSNLHSIAGPVRHCRGLLCRREHLLEVSGTKQGLGVVIALCLVQAAARRPGGLPALPPAARGLRRICTPPASSHWCPSGCRG